MGAREHTRTIMITGAAGAIGAAVARAFAAAPCLLVLSDMRAPDYMEAIQTEFVTAKFIGCDLSRREEIDSMFDELNRSLTRLDILVNAAGVVSKGPSELLQEAEWDRVLGINLKGVFFTCQRALGLMRPYGFGRIINIGSVIARNGGNARPWVNPEEQFASSNVAYAAAKAGVHSMSSFLAREYARFGITVNVVAPGPVATAMIQDYPRPLIQQIPAQRLGAPDEVAAAVLFLASDAAGFVNGATLDMNGGLYVR